MLFNSAGYLFLFLPIVFALYWWMPQRFRTSLLLFSSCIFYMLWNPIYIVLILALAAANYVLGQRIHQTVEKKKQWLTVGILINVMTLGFFKYAYSVHGLLDSIAGTVGYKINEIPFQIILPLGISFFIFEFIHYLVDIYRGSEPVRSITQFGLFATFFPTQIAGPIKRYQDFVPQLDEEQKFSMTKFDEAMTLLLTGLFKKVVIADNLAVVVQASYSNPDLLTSADLWLASYTFAMQLYCDFSGYTDMARGSAQLFNFKVPINFDKPYFAGSVTDFWRRWHITLGSWLRNYVYIPLGGSRTQSINIYRNLFITMVVCGLWHGAGFTYVLYGVIQGIYVCVHRAWQAIVQKNAVLTSLMQNKIYQVLAVLFTFNATCAAFVVFRADNIKIAGKILQKMFFLTPAPEGLTNAMITLPTTKGPAVYSLLPILLPTLVVAHYLAGKKFSWLLNDEKQPGRALIIRTAYVATFICMLIALAPDATPKFIYFQF